MHGYHRGEHGMLEKNLFIISNAFVLLFHMALSVSASRIFSLEVQSLSCILLFLFSFLFSLYLKRPVVSSLETLSTSASLFSFFFFFLFSFSYRHQSYLSSLFSLPFSFTSLSCRFGGFFFFYFLFLHVFLLAITPLVLLFSFFFFYWWYNLVFFCFSFYFLFYLPSDMKLIRIIFIFPLERGSLMSLPLVFFFFFFSIISSLIKVVFFSFFNTLFLFFRALSLREFGNYFFIIFIFFFLPRCINLNIFFISIIFLVVFSNAHFHSLSDISFFFILLSFAFLSLEAVFIRYLSPFFISNFHSLPHVRLVFWNSIHLEVASDPFSFLINSPWLLVFALCVFFLFQGGFNLYCWKGIHFSWSNSLIFIFVLFLGLIFSFHFWFRDLLRELNKKYEILLMVLFLVFFLFLASEGLLFVSFFWASFHSLSSPTL